jgi:hypothetical protein
MFAAGDMIVTGAPFDADADSFLITIGSLR